MMSGEICSVILEISCKFWYKFKGREGLVFLFLQQKRNKPRLFAETMRAFKKQ
jgi:hypothetical protein